MTWDEAKKIFEEAVQNITDPMQKITALRIYKELFGFDVIAKPVFHIETKPLNGENAGNK